MAKHSLPRPSEVIVKQFEDSWWITVSFKKSAVAHLKGTKADAKYYEGWYGPLILAMQKSGDRNMRGASDGHYYGGPGRPFVNGPNVNIKGGMVKVWNHGGMDV